MGKAVTHGKGFGAWRKSRPIAHRRQEARAREAIDPAASNTRVAHAALTRLRVVVQDRIVAAFRGQAEGSGPGPADADLLLFARLAVAETRLSSALEQIGAEGSGDDEVLRLLPYVESRQG